MSDPVITRSGYSYERSAILEWLKTNNTDPITQEFVTADELWPNLALKRMYDNYMQVKNNK
jgi:STIP1 family protein 1